MKKTAKPNIRPDWMKKSPKVSKEYAEKRAQTVREWDTWPKATEAQARRADQRLEAAFNRNGRDNEKRARAIRQFDAMDIPRRFRPEVERVRNYMAGSIHDPVAVASVAAFFLGVELQDEFPEFSRKIKPHARASRANKAKKQERHDYMLKRFSEEIAKDPNRQRRHIEAQIRSELKQMGHKTGIGHRTMAEIWTELG